MICDEIVYLICCTCVVGMCEVAKKLKKKENVTTYMVSRLCIYKPMRWFKHIFIEGVSFNFKF